MTIKTKFGVDDEVFFIQQNKIQTAKIKDVIIRAFMPPVNPGAVTTEIHYHVGGYTDLFKETQVFSKKDELLASL